MIPGLSRRYAALLCAVLTGGAGAQDVAPSASDSARLVRVELASPDLAPEVRALLDRHAAVLAEAPAADEPVARAAWLRRARRDIGELLASEGYFSPRISLDETQSPPRMSVVGGERARISSVDIRFVGTHGLATDTAMTGRSDALRRGWSLKPGEPFRQARWSAAKQGLLDALQAEDFAAAMLVDSRAEVDVPAASVALTLEYDSGPPFRYGALNVQGLRDYDASLVRRFVRLPAGGPYRREALLAAQRALQAAPQFAAAQIDISTDTSQADAAPITVTVSEAAPKRLAVGAGVSSNTGYRVEGSGSTANLFERAWHLNTVLRVEQKRQMAFADVFLPPDAGDWRNSVGALAENTDIQGLETRRYATGLVRAKLRGGDEVRYAATWQHEQLLDHGVPASSQQALALNASWIWRTVDDVLDPREGHAINLQIGGASHALLSDTDFIRGYVRAQRWWPLGLRDQFTLRAEAGLTAGQRTGIPQEYLFRSGGSQSVRGYSYLGLGVRDGSAVSGGRVLGVLSAEYTHWLRDNWGAALFVDAGDAAASAARFDTAFGLGVGARYRSPAGPIAFDLAWGERDRRVRPHFSLAISF